LALLKGALEALQEQHDSAASELASVREAATSAAASAAVTQQELQQQVCVGKVDGVFDRGVYVSIQCMCTAL
jgi:hypothetical protein